MIKTKRTRDTIAADRPAAQLAWVLVFAGTVLLTIWVRTVHYRDAWIDGRLLPLGGDSAYHLRRMMLFASGEGSATTDPSMGWPVGSVAIWPPGFDRMGALLIALFGTGESAGDGAAAGALPVLLAAITAIIIVAIIRTLGRGPWVAACAGIVFALLPQSVAIGRFGRIDHHVAEAMFTAGLCLWTLHITCRSASSARGRSLVEAVGALLVSLAIWTAMVNLVVVGIASLALIFASLASVPDPDSTADAHHVPPKLLGSGGISLGAGAVLLAMLFAPQVAAHGEPWSHARPSYLQPMLLGLAGAAVTLTQASGTWISPAIPQTPRLLRRLGVSALGVAVTFGLVAVLAPNIARGVSVGATQYLGSGDQWLSSIGEMQPMFLDSPFTIKGWAQANEFYGPVLMALPITCWFAWRGRTRAKRHAMIVTFGWAMLLVVLSLMQSRWGRPMTVMLSVVTALGIAGAAGAALQNIETHFVRWVIPAVLAGGLIAALGTTMLPKAEGKGSPVQQAALALRAGEGAANGGGQGVLSTWDHGNQILALSERPVVVGGFGPYITPDLFAEADLIWLAPPSELDAFLRTRDIGYIVAGAGTFYPRLITPSGLLPLAHNPDGVGVLASRYFAEVPCGVLMVGGSGAPKRGIEHLAHLRPRFASTETVKGLAQPLPVLWAYERVEGATITGSAKASSRVVATIDLQFAAGTFRYRAWADADRTGTFSVRLPVATAQNDVGLSTPDAVLVERDGEPPVAISVPIDAVYQGTTLRL